MIQICILINCNRATADYEVNKPENSTLGVDSTIHGSDTRPGIRVRCANASNVEIARVSIL